MTHTYLHMQIAQCNFKHKIWFIVNCRMLHSDLQNILFFKAVQLGMVIVAYNLNTRASEVGGLEVQSHPELDYNETQLLKAEIHR